jgi:hypothetical protein
MINIENKTNFCHLLHQLLNKMPIYLLPSEVNFNNGLYFFYEKGETCSHTGNPRIVRIGNHKSKNGLIGRLNQHYKEDRYWSSHRRLLGGALLRKQNLEHDCIQPSPGQGHWEKQKHPDRKKCESCKIFETNVTAYLKAHYWFRCIEVTDKEYRYELEPLLIATIHQCPNCSASENWLGRFAFDEKVKNGKLWQSHHLNGSVFSKDQFENFKALINKSIDNH